MFGMQLAHVQSKLQTFCKVNELIIGKNRAKAVASAFEQWKSWKAL
jgi:hypothetical protein